MNQTNNSDRITSQYEMNFPRISGTAKLPADSQRIARAGSQRIARADSQRIARAGSQRIARAGSQSDERVRTNPSGSKNNRRTSAAGRRNGNGTSGRISAGISNRTGTGISDRTGRAARRRPANKTTALFKKRAAAGTSVIFKELLVYFDLSIILPALIKWAVFAAIIVMLFRMAGGTKHSDTPFDRMESVVTSAAVLDNTAQADGQMIRRLYGFSQTDFDGVLLYSPTTNMGAEELLLVHVSSTNEAESVSHAVEARLASQLSSFNGYGVDQTEMLENSITLSEGDYILFYSGKDPQKVKSAFEGAL